MRPILIATLIAAALSLTSCAQSAGLVQATGRLVQSATRSFGL